jgi:hypothetical protein
LLRSLGDYNIRAAKVRGKEEKKKVWGLKNGSEPQK